MRNFLQQRLGGCSEDRDGVLYACVRKPRPWLAIVYSEGYFFRFYFDTAGQLLRIEGKESFTGP